MIVKIKLDNDNWKIFGDVTELDFDSKGFVAFFDEPCKCDNPHNECSVCRGLKKKFSYDMIKFSEEKLNELFTHVLLTHFRDWMRCVDKGSFNQFKKGLG